MIAAVKARWAQIKGSVRIDPSGHQETYGVFKSIKPNHWRGREQIQLERFKKPFSKLFRGGSLTLDERTPPQRTTPSSSI